MYSQAVSPSLAPALDSEYEGDAAAVVEHKVSERGEMEGRPASSSSSVAVAAAPSSSGGRGRKRAIKTEVNEDKSGLTTPPAATSSTSSSSLPVSHKRTRSIKAPSTPTKPPAAPVAVEDGAASRFDQYTYSPSDKGAHHIDTTTAAIATAFNSVRKRGRPAKAK